MTELSDAHKLIRDTARRVAREKIAPRAAEWRESGEYPQDIFAAYRDVGLLGLSVPQEYGGSGAGFLALALAVEQIADECTSPPLILPLSAPSPAPASTTPSTGRRSTSPASPSPTTSASSPSPTATAASLEAPTTSPAS